jgi:hypothetical protein
MRKRIRRIASLVALGAVAGHHDRRFPESFFPPAIVAR